MVRGALVAHDGKVMYPPPVLKKLYQPQNTEVSKDPEQLKIEEASRQKGRAFQVGMLILGGLIIGL